MNSDTLVAVCCYEGDQHQVNDLMPVFEHHKCPIVVLSPEDSQAHVPDHPNIYGGKRGYVGQDAIDRWNIQLRILLDFPQQFFLINDSDSFLLDAPLPDEWYANPDTLWSNLVLNQNPEQLAAFPEGWPHIAFHPPWFMSRRVIERLLSVKDDPRLLVNPITPFIDFQMVGAATIANIPWKAMAGGLGFPMAQPAWAIRGFNEVRHRGARAIHSVKDAGTMKLLREARAEYLRGRVGRIHA